MAKAKTDWGKYGLKETKLEGSYWDRVREKADAIQEQGVKVDVMAARIREIMDEKEKLEERTEALNVSLEANKLAVLRVWRETGTQQQAFKSIGTLYVETVPLVKTIDKEELLKSLRELDIDIAQVTVHAGTLSATVKDLLVDGRAIPKGIEVTINETVKLLRKG